MLREKDVDREKIYSKWKNTRRTDGKLAFGEETLERVKNLSDQALLCFDEYFDSIVASGAVDSMQTYRSKILSFLEYISARNIELSEVTQEVIDAHFFENREKGLEERGFYLKKLFAYFNVEGIDVDKHKNPKNRSAAEKMPWINAETFSRAQDIYKSVRKSNAAGENEDSIKKYKLATKKLFVLKMFFYTPLRIEYIGDYWKIGLPVEDNAIIFNGKMYNVPLSLIELITEIRESGLIDDPMDMKTILDNLRNELAEFNMGKLDSTGAKKTRDTIFWTCPQCGNIFEAIAENWCVKQYTEDGENWVVCREYCAYE